MADYYQRFIIVVANDRIFRLDTALGDTWVHVALSDKHDEWEKVHEPVKAHDRPAQHIQHPAQAK